jgi:hypothetical protein
MTQDLHQTIRAKKATTRPRPALRRLLDDPGHSDLCGLCRPGGALAAVPGCDDGHGGYVCRAWSGGNMNDRGRSHLRGVCHDGGRQCEGRAERRCRAGGHSNIAGGRQTIIRASGIGFMRRTEQCGTEPMGMRVAAKPEQRAYCPWQQQEGWSVRLKSCPAQANRLQPVAIRPRCVSRWRVRSCALTYALPSPHRL